MSMRMKLNEVVGVKGMKVVKIMEKASAVVLIVVLSILPVQAQDCGTTRAVSGSTIEAKSVTCPLVGQPCFTQFTIDNRNVTAVCQFPWADYDECDTQFEVDDCINIKGHYGEMPTSPPTVVLFVEGFQPC